MCAPGLVLDMHPGFSASGRVRLDGSAITNSHTTVVSSTNSSTFQLGKPTQPSGLSFAQQLYASATPTAAHVNHSPSPITPSLTDRRSTSSRNSSVPASSYQRQSISPHIPSITLPPHLPLSSVNYATQSEPRVINAGELYHASVTSNRQSGRLSTTAHHTHQYTPHTPVSAYTPSPDAVTTYRTTAPQRSAQAPSQPGSHVTTASRRRSSPQPQSRHQGAYPSPPPSSTGRPAYTESPPYTPLPTQPTHISRVTPQPPSSLPSLQVAQPNRPSPPPTNSSQPSSPPYVANPRSPESNYQSLPTRSTSVSSTTSRGASSHRNVVPNSVLFESNGSDDGRLSSLSDEYQNFTIGNGSDYGGGTTHSIPTSSRNSHDQDSFDLFASNNADSSAGAHLYDTYDPLAGDGDPYSQTQCPLPEYDDGGYLSYTGPEGGDYDDPQDTNQNVPDTNPNADAPFQQESDQQHNLYQQQQQPQLEQAQIRPQPSYQDHRSSEHSQQPIHAHQSQQPPSTHPNTSATISQQDINHVYVPSSTPFTGYSQTTPSGPSRQQTPQPHRPPSILPSGHFYHVAAATRPSLTSSSVIGPGTGSFRSQHADTLPLAHKPNQAFTVARPPPGQQTQARPPTSLAAPVQAPTPLRPPVPPPPPQLQHNYNQVQVTPGQNPAPRPQYAYNQAPVSQAQSRPQPQAQYVYSPAPPPRPPAPPQSTQYNYNQVLVSPSQAPGAFGVVPVPSGSGNMTGYVILLISVLLFLTLLLPRPSSGFTTPMVQPHVMPFHSPQHANTFPTAGVPANGGQGTPAQVQYQPIMLQPTTVTGPSPSSPPATQPQKDPDNGVNAQKIVQYAQTAASIAGVAVKIFQAAETLTGENNTGSNNVFF